MLQRMYTRWSERHGFKVELVDESEGEQAASNPRRCRSRATMPMAG